MPDGAGRLWKPKDYDGKFGGPSTLRTGLEMSRNLMTVRLARHLGMDLVAEYGRAFGLYDKLAPYLPMSLGAGETTLTRLVSAYAVLANGGHAVQPSMIDRIRIVTGVRSSVTTIAPAIDATPQGGCIRKSRCFATPASRCSTQ